ncbi:MAG: hypothetical protein NVS9B15_02690 [Acidobacteriaceae bacterium]
MRSRLLLPLALIAGLTVAQNQKPSTGYGPTNDKPGKQPGATQNEGATLEKGRQQDQQQGGVLGIISDAKCGRAHTVFPGMGPTGCARECVSRGSSYVLVTNDRVIPLTGNKQILENYAGQSVRILGGMNVQRENQIQASYTPGLVTPSMPAKP